jgi:hypothetical protein
LVEAASACGEGCAVSEKSTAGNTQWVGKFQPTPAKLDSPNISLALPILIRHASEAGQYCHHYWVKQSCLSQLTTGTL